MSGCGWTSPHVPHAGYLARQGVFSCDGVQAPAGNELRREDDLPDTLSRLLEVQACAVLLLAVIHPGDLDPRAYHTWSRLVDAVEKSTPGAVEAVKKALRGGR